MSWLFKKRKQLIETSELAISLFKENKVISDASMERYIKTLKDFAQFLLTKRKSLLDAKAKDVYEYLGGELEKRATEKAILSSFYRTMIRLGHYKGANPVAELPKLIEKINKKKKKALKDEEHETEEEVTEEDYAAMELESLILNELGEGGEESTKETTKPEKPKPNYRKLMSAEDFENLILKTSHIRDRAVLELLWWTGLRPMELCELRVKDVDLVKRRIYVRGKRVKERTILMNRRLQKVLERYLEWRNKQMAPTDKLIITPRSKEPLTSSALAGHLSRLQRDKPRKERFTTRDFRRRAIINYYYLTRDIVATHRFSGMKSTAATMNLINQILEERGVSSIEELAELTEFKDGLITPTLKEEDDKDKEKDREKLKNKPQKITILLTPEEQELIRKAGITPASAIRGMLSLREFYQQLAPQGVSFAAAPSFGQGMAAATAPRPSVSSAPRTPRPPTNRPKMPLPKPGGGGGGGASPAAYISELKEILKKRRQKADQEIAEAEKKEKEEEEKKKQEVASGPQPPSPSGGPQVGSQPKITVVKEGPNAPKF